MCSSKLYCSALACRCFVCNEIHRNTASTGTPLRRLLQSLPPAPPCSSRRCFIVVPASLQTLPSSDPLNSMCGGTLDCTRCLSRQLRSWVARMQVRRLCRCHPNCPHGMPQYRTPPPPRDPFAPGLRIKPVAKQPDSVQPRHV